MKSERCKQCGAWVIWAGLNSEPTRRTPLDARPWANYGNLHLDTSHGTYIVLEPEMIDRAHARGFELYTNHLYTCPARERQSRFEQTFGPQEKEIYEHAN